MAEQNAPAEDVCEERIVSTDYGELMICKCGRIAMPNQYHCTACEP